MRRRLLAIASQALTKVESRSQGSVRGLAEAAAVPELKKTPLYDFHVKSGGEKVGGRISSRLLVGKMVEFCGWSMPVQYGQSVMESTKYCRKKALLFDVSHMCGLSLRVRRSVVWLMTKA